MEENNNNVYKSTPDPKKGTPGTNKSKNKKILIGGLAALLVLIVVLLVVFLQKPGKDASAVPSGLEPVSAPINPGEIDFEALQERNEDVIAWVEVPGTVISYPVLKGLDNAYYLDKDIDEQYDIGGSIFNDMGNDNGFTDPLTALYGHNMPDGSQFTQLHDFRDKDFFDKNREILVYLPEDGKKGGKKLEYEIIAAFDMGTDNLLYEKDYTQEKDRKELQEFLQNPDVEDANVAFENPQPDDKYILLMTCQSVEDNTSRFALFGRLKNPEVLAPEDTAAGEADGSASSAAQATAA